MPIYVPSNPTEPTTQVIPMNKQVRKIAMN